MKQTLTLSIIIYLTGITSLMTGCNKEALEKSQNRNLVLMKQAAEQSVAMDARDAELVKAGEEIAHYKHLALVRPEDIKSEIDKLEIKKMQNSDKISESEHKLTALKNELNAVKHEIANKKATKIHILKVQIRQSSFTLSIKKHISNSINAEEFEIPVDEHFYNNIRIGEDIMNEFRVGSAIMYGHLGTWKLKVVGKRIEKIN